MYRIAPAILRCPWQRGWRRYRNRQLVGRTAAIGHQLDIRLCRMGDDHRGPDCWRERRRVRSGKERAALQGALQPEGPLPRESSQGGPWRIPVVRTAWNVGTAGLYRI